MADIVDRATRSRMMAGIGGKDTAPELTVRRFLHREGFRFRLHRRDLPGRPDVVLARYRVAVLVHGCFWHRHSSCRYATTPSSNREFWHAKFAQNVARDRRNLRELRRLGWTPIVVWECSLSPSRLAALKRKIQQARPGSGKGG
ncbi:MAG: DNA mismatch endonuclease Vsr [Gemmatimonadetes bacterium]|nr:DNA mismatch endonuclease Vsr [Gemmatimonadota bacterium]MBK9411514.1 DNA mismatch endonuclease Vsr [Gemmatimonadota bacterium]